MLHLIPPVLIPPALHRTALRLAHGLRQRWWRLRKPQLRGCRVLAINSQGHVLLVRHSYGSPCWMPPGGGLKRSEDPIVAGERELIEETGCTLAEARIIAVIDEPLHGAQHRVFIVAGYTASVPQADRREIVAAQFFDPQALPQHLGKGLREAIPAWIAGYSEQR